MLRKLWRDVRKLVDLRDVFVFGGIGCAAYGVGQVHPPAAWMLVGVAFFWLGSRG
jgi:hypothetical protein